MSEHAGHSFELGQLKLLEIFDLEQISSDYFSFEEPLEGRPTDCRL